MSLKNIDMESAMRRLADRRIEEAMREGKFDNLAGAGKPLDLEPMPANENARLMWWALRLLRQNDFMPEEVRWRKQIDNLKDELAGSTTDRRVVALVAQINRLVHQLNTLGTNALTSPIAPVSLEAERHRLRDRLARGPSGSSSPAPTVHLTPGAIRHCGNAACKSRNAGSARYCRRCGSELPAS